MIGPIAAFWALMTAGVIARGPLLLSVFFVAGAFGTLAVVPPALTGGVTILPQVTCAICLLAWLAFRRRAMGEVTAAAVNPRDLGLLFLFFIYCAAATAFLPLLFEGQANVIPFRSTAPGTTPLAPTNSNMTQMLYLFASCATAAAFHVLWRQPDNRRSILKAMLAGGVVLVLTGIADMLTAGSAVLDSFRTASYALMTNDDMAGVKRVVGLMSEASAFGGACVAMGAALYFLRDGFAFLGRWRPLVSLTMAGLFAMALASTSTSAYAGLAVFFVLAAGNFLSRLVRRDPIPRTNFAEDMTAFFVVALGAIGVFFFSREIADMAAAMFDEVVLQKAASSSFTERAHWNDVAIEALRETYWLGVGIGSTRVSSWPISIVTNAGIPGAAMLLLFLCTLFLRRTDGLHPTERAAATGMKLAIIVSLSMASLAATTPDFGLLVGAMLGGVSGLASAARAARGAFAAPARKAFFRPRRFAGGYHGVT